MANLTEIMGNNGDLDNLTKRLEATLQDLLKDTNSASDVASGIQEDTFKNNLAMQDDGDVPVGKTSDEEVEKVNLTKSDFEVLNNSGVVTNSPEQASKVIDGTKRFLEKLKKESPNTITGEPKTPDILQKEATAKALLDLDKQALGKRDGYDKPVTQDFIKENVSDSKVMEDITGSLLAYADECAKETEAIKKVKSESIKKEWKDKPSSYRDKTYTDKDGNAVSYKLIKKPVDFGRYLKGGRSGYNLDTIKRLVTEAMLDTYGSWDRITSIVVRDSHLIVNNTSFIPMIEKKYITPENFPLDTLAYFQECKMAYFFKWSELKHMQNLVLLDIDDVQFYTGVVGQELDVGRRIGVSTPFRICNRLDILVLGDKKITRDELNTPESKEIKEKVNVSKRFWNFSDGYKINVVSATNGLQSWTINSLVNFANNRKDHCFFGHWLGIGVGAAAAGTAILANLGVHLAWGVKNLFTASTTPIDESDLGINK